VASQLAAKERSSPRPEASLKAQAEAVQRQMEKERAEHQRRLELLETQLESSSLDNQVRLEGPSSTRLYLVINAVVGTCDEFIALLYIER
jgi:hypothetical protein